MKIITPILFISIYFFSLLGTGLKAFDCCDSVQSLSISGCAFQQENKSSVNAKCHSFKLKDVHIAPSVIKAPGHFHAQVARLVNTSLQRLFLPNNTIGTRSNAVAAIRNNVPVYVYGCVFRI